MCTSTEFFYEWNFPASNNEIKHDSLCRFRRWDGRSRHNSSHQERKEAEILRGARLLWIYRSVLQVINILSDPHRIKLSLVWLLPGFVSNVKWRSSSCCVSFIAGFKVDVLITAPSHRIQTGEEERKERCGHVCFSWRGETMRRQLFSGLTKIVQWFNYECTLSLCTRLVEKQTFFSISAINC